MTVIYAEIPEFKERIPATTLIIVGTIKDLIRTKGDINDSGQEHIETTYEVNITKTLKGVTRTNSVKVRVLEDKVKASGLAHAEKGDRVLFMLSPDYGPNMKEDSFVLYFNSGYIIQDENQVIVDESTVKQLANEKIPIDNGKVPLESVNALIDSIMNHKQNQDTVLEQLEPADLRKRPYPEISEFPQPTNGGGMDSSLEGQPTGAE